MWQFKWLRCRIMIIATFTALLIANIGFIGFFLAGYLRRTNIVSNHQTSVNSSNDLNKSLNQSLSYRDYVLTLERRINCNLKTPNKCFSTEKSLVITFWSQKSRQRWLALNILSIFPEKYFDYMVMIHDNSTWSHHPAYNKIIWINVKDQLRFWYIKRFLSPHTLRAYNYIWVVDDDARFYFNPRVYECIADKYRISLSSPSRGEGFIIHRITKIQPSYISRIGRWTDFIEIGPLFIAKSSIWLCLWKYLDERVGLGYGLDDIWCRLLGERCSLHGSIYKTCAILDAFVAHHDSKTVNTVSIGSLEIPAYRKYMSYLSKKNVFGTIAHNSTDLYSCNTNVTESQSYNS